MRGAVSIALAYNQVIKFEVFFTIDLLILKKEAEMLFLIHYMSSSIKILMFLDNTFLDIQLMFSMNFLSPCSSYDNLIQIDDLKDEHISNFQILIIYISIELTVCKIWTHSTARKCNYDH